MALLKRHQTIRTLRKRAGEAEDHLRTRRFDKGGILDGISAAASANATGQVMAAVQLFAAKQATQTQAAAAAALIETIRPASPTPGPAHMGQHVDASV